MEKDMQLMEKIISLAKRRGFIYPGSEIYGGMAGSFDYGPLGVKLKNNIKESWRKKFLENRKDKNIFELETALIMNPKVWQTSGHVGGFSDPLVECEKCHKRFRADTLENKNECPECGGNFGEERQFNMMFQTNVGAVEDSSSVAYFRPETAQGMFVNFKNIMDSFHPKLPFGIAQIGKAFRNEITPRDFIFRVREFEQMEIEYFIREENWQAEFNYWKDEMLEWIENIGLDMNKIHEIEKESGDLAHYSKRTVDFEFDFPFGQKELYGLAYRTDYDLTVHQKESGVSLEYFDEENGERFIPHVIEPSFGVDRTVLALLASTYNEEEKDGETRVYLKLKPSIAPTIACVSPLLKNKEELVHYANSVYMDLKNTFGNIAWDDNGNIGKRYRRQDEIGTPWCIVIDFDTLTDHSVTVRDRDTGAQVRMHKDNLAEFIKESLN